MTTKVGLLVLLSTVATVVWQRNVLAAYLRQAVDPLRRLERRAVGAMQRSSTTLGDVTSVDDTYRIHLGSQVWERVRWSRSDTEAAVASAVARAGARTKVRVDRDVTVSVTHGAGLRRRQVRVETFRRAGAPTASVALVDPETAETWEIACSPAKIGRDPTADIVIDEPSVSWRHATVTVDGDRLRITDDGSSNGTFVNRRAARAVADLRNGDEVELGRVRLRVAMTNGPSQTSVLAGPTTPLDPDRPERTGGGTKVL